ncbi:metalloregulator ArsR/SmtB family transcription factor [Sphingobium sp. CR28]|uniref:metalloregulator ArsR/SmtB family transcription factor n=1 Tax=Sphingobium sp. CR28 TaxID=3400272 RepID=UPI003FEFA726
MDSVFDALAHPTRRRILEMLRQGAMSAGDLANAFPVSKPTMSAHFAKLKAAGLVQAESRGTSLIYTLNLSVVEEALMGFMGRLNLGASKEDGQ